VLPLIVNPTAGGGRARGIALRVVEALRARGQPVQLFTTREAGEATELARAAVRSGASAGCGLRR
jgi:diacylglycerol kinase (ATP)